MMPIEIATQRCRWRSISSKQGLATEDSESGGANSGFDASKRPRIEENHVKTGENGAPGAKSCSGFRLEVDFCQPRFVTFGIICSVSCSRVGWTWTTGFLRRQSAQPMAFEAQTAAKRPWNALRAQLRHLKSEPERAKRAHTNLRRGTAKS